MNNNKLNIGIIGIGTIGVRRHIPAFKRNGQASVKAICDSDIEKVKKVANRFNISESFSNLDKFLSSSIDAISIVTPPPTHFSIAKKALRKNKHVLVEKPMVIKKEEGKELQAIAQEKDLVLCPSHNFHFCRAVSQATEVINKNNFGELINVKGVQWSSWDRKLPTWYPDLPGGLFFDESPHFFYLLQQFLGNIKIEQVEYRSKKTYGKKNISYNIRVSGQEGEGEIRAWFGAPISEWFVILDYTKAVLVIDIFRNLLLYFPSLKDRKYSHYLRLLHGIYQSMKGVSSLAISRLRKHNLFGLEELAGKYVKAILENKDSPIPPEEGWGVVGLTEETLERANIYKKNEEK